MKHALPLLTALLLAPLSLAASGAANQTYYVDSTTGNDDNNGLAPQTAWRTLQKASGRNYTAGDRLLLRGGCVFKGKLLLHAAGNAHGMVVVGTYQAHGGNAPPVIDAKGFLAGVQIVDSSYVEIRDLEIMTDAGEPVEKAADSNRAGVLITAQKAGNFGHITLRSLWIHDIFATTASPSEGKNPTTSMGVGIDTSANAKMNAALNDIHVENCVIEKTGYTGIRLGRTDDVSIVSNTLRLIGGPGMVPFNCKNLVVRGNLVDGSGSSIDERMHGRGSGIWPFSCTNVLIDGNAFLHARGRDDSCGAHIDLNNSDVVIQRNLSVDNEGGFIEVLQKNHNCTYRYNISINDGARVKRQDGADQDGHTIQVWGHPGKNEGPFNTYIYNNTIFVKPGLHSELQIAASSQGVLVANNIFNIAENVGNNPGPWKTRIEKESGAKCQNVIFRNNLASGELPENWTENTGEQTGDPQFRNPGGFKPADYIPGNKAAVKGTGTVIGPLPSDEIGLKAGFRPETDFFGNKIPDGAPDIGAIVFGGGITQTPHFGATQSPTGKQGLGQ